MNIFLFFYLFILRDFVYYINPTIRYMCFFIEDGLKSFEVDV